ncbi:lytic transglycosylase domain-containing protein [Eubacteriales bacterium OttesenSCG-928-N13]|nr:lytic transglycosylase domain-containing protein [Eubacteriales bacterium OttesenSCG-928-N13]
MSETVMVRNRRRPPRRTGLRWIWLGALVLLLIGISIYFITSFPEDVQKISYPLSYVDEIRAQSEQFQLDPARVAAVIYCESSFRPEVTSSAGARGLMQIMPETGAWIAGKFEDIEDYSDDMLFDPNINIRLGCWYLNYLDNLFDGDLTKATAAYHSGQGNVSKWLQDEQNSTDGVTLMSIPSAATDTYVKRVKQAYEQYKELLTNESQA